MTESLVYLLVLLVPFLGVLCVGAYIADNFERALRKIYSREAR